jgi:cysteine desulfurase
MSNLSLPVYMDYQATTPLDAQVLEAMMPYLTSKFGNPHSISHKFGWEAEAGVDLARAQVARLIGATPQEIIFTSGATEANNMAIKGVMQAMPPDKRHIVTVATEHSCVLESCRALERVGFRVTYLDVTPSGLIDLDILKDALTPDTGLISVMAVNNEIGTIQPVREIGQIAREKGILFHCDAAQAYGKIPLDVDDMNIALMSLSGHKIYGPKGIGALYLRASRPKIRLLPLMDGGGQEQGLRSGTLSPALCAGFGQAAVISGQNMTAEYERLARFSARLVHLLQNNLAGVHVNGDLKARFPGNLNIGFDGVNGDLLLADLKGLAVSSGAACASASGKTSYVLRAIGVPEKLAKASLRIGIGRMTSDAEIDYAGAQLIEKVTRLRTP